MGVYNRDLAADQVVLINPATGLPFTAAGQPVDTTDRPARQLGIVQLKDVISLSTLSTAGNAIALTIPANATLFNYLAYLQIILYASAAMVGGAAPVAVPVTGIASGPVYVFPSALAIGQIAEQKYEGAAPLKGSAINTTIVISAPAIASGIWRINAAYFQA